MSRDVPRIAIVGASSRLGIGRGRDALARALVDDRSPFRPLPPERFDPAVFAGDFPPGRVCQAQGTLIDDYSLDFRTLRLPPMAAEKMHRMERVALATMAEALDDAGIHTDRGPTMHGRIVLAATSLAPDPATDHGPRIRRYELAAPVSEAVGACLPDERTTIEEYVEQLFNLAAPPVESDSMATSASVLAGRIANLFDFRGGHFAMDAGASSSLAAVAEAVDVLRAGEADVVLVCAISPLLTASHVLAMAHRGELATSRVRPGAPDAEGTLLGEGCVAIVLQREHDARGPVLAFIEGVGQAVSGRAPEPADVALAATRALEDAGVSAEGLVGCFTRTAGIPAADAIELRGLAQAYGAAGHIVRSTVPQTGFLGPAGGLTALLAAAHALASDDFASLGQHPLPFTTRESRLAVSDAGMSPVIHQAILAGPSSRARTRAIGAAAAEAAAPRETSIAIVGCGALVPGASDAPTFFRNVLAGAETFDDLDERRWDVARLVGASAELATILTSRLAGTIDRSAIGASRLGMSEAAHAAIDPSVAMCLGAGTEALRTASLDVSRWDPDRVAVIIGQLPIREHEIDAEKRVLFAGHLQLVADAMREASLPEARVDEVVALARRTFDLGTRAFDATTYDAFSGIGAAHALALRHGFRGGIACVDAACASSLVALDVARRKLASGELDAVLVGGVAANLLPEYYIALGILGFLSPEGHAPFDERSNGFVPAESAAFVVLRRTRDARASGERIVATLRSIGLSSDGRTSSVLAPSTRGQRLAIERALAAAGATPRSIEALEVHGAGTRLGDRTEMLSYVAAYGDRDPAEVLSLGTVKSQVGHASSASGLVSIVKMAMALDAGLLPPARSPELPDSELGLEGVPFAFARVARPWGRIEGQPRRAAVSAFGLGGMNAHAILEEAERTPASARAPLPIAVPPAGLVADRFSVELVPLALPARPPTTPVAGRRVLLLRDAGELHVALAAELTRRGAFVTSLDDAALDVVRCADADVILDLGELGARDARCLALPVAAFTALVEAQYTRLVRIFRAVYERLSDAPAGAVTFACVTSLGGTLGLTPTDLGDPLGASALGMMKGLKQELPHAHVKAVDWVTRDLDAACRALVDELEDGNDRVEVALMPERWAANLRRSSFEASQQATRPIRAGDVYVFSGGGRGVAFECAAGLATLGACVVVTGRTDLGDTTEPWFAMDDATFEDFRRRELVRRRTLDRTITPARFAEEFDRIASRREIHRNLERARRFGLPIEYRRCDVTDPEAVRRCLSETRARFGKVDTFVHAAMVEWSRSLPKKSAEDVRRTVATKVIGLYAIVAALEHEPVSSLIAFGSGAGRFGNRGQVDYSGANAVMAALLPRLVRTLGRPMHAATIDWTAWSGVGAAAANPDIAALVEATGVTSITPDEGRYWFASELAAGRSDEVVIFEERMLSDWPFLGSRADGTGERRVYADDRGELLVPGEFPLVDFVLERAPERLVLERTFELPADAFLEHHRLHGVPIVPATFGLELLAETAALAAPGFHVHVCRDVRIDVPLKLFHEKPVLVTGTAEWLPDTSSAEGSTPLDPDVRRFSVVVTSTFARRGLPDERRVHVSGIVELHRGEREARARVDRSSKPPASFAPPDEATRHARSFFHLARDPVRLGPLFCNAHELRVGETCVTGKITAPRLDRVTRRTRRPRFQTDPMVLDAAFQIAANWDGRRQRWVSIPFGIAEVFVHGLRRDAEPTSVRATVVQVTDPDVHYDIEIRGDDERPLMTVRGLHLRRIAPLEADA